MARRSSARLRAKVSSTPQGKRVSKSGQDESLHTPRRASKLTTLTESDEMPGAFPQSTSPVETSPSRLAEHIAQAITGEHATPKHATPIKPSMEEMHPQKYQMTTAKPLDEARWLGFSNMVPQTEPAKGSNKIVAQQGTPTKMQKAKAAFEHPPDFKFTFNRPSLDLSPEARKLMAEKRDEAAKIRGQMKASQESGTTARDLLARKMATPKAKIGRFSDVHMNQFKKMDSIADHPSAFRADAVRSNPAHDDKTPKKTSSYPNLAVPKSLKRTQSKADLTQSSTALPRPTSKPDLHQPPATEAPAKRVKRELEDDTATSRPRSAGSDEPAPAAATPKPSTSLRHPHTNTHLKGLGTPTAASLARAASVKSIKRTMIPALARSPSKPDMSSLSQHQHQPKPSTPLLARSPSKLAPPATVFESKINSTALEPQSPLLSRSAVKPPPRTHASTLEHDDADQEPSVRFLARSPSKMSMTEKIEGEDQPNKTKLLLRSPSKIAIPEASDNSTQTPAKSTGTNLMSRFNLLRKSPVKSILRTPQRLYSNDPLKLASGTHFATPEKDNDMAARPFLAAPPKTAPVRKHVDFTASTKGIPGLEDRPQTPSKESINHSQPTKDVQASVVEPSLPHFSYPSLPPHDTDVKKSHRRMTMALPSDFTFRAGGEIVFGPSPNRTAASSNIKASIRHVSAEPELASASSKKRKLSGLDDQHTGTSRNQELSDKENSHLESEAEHRPAKKAKTSAPDVRTTQPSKTPQPAKTPRRFTTLGVKPKSTQKPTPKRPGLLSQARLNALATPKRR
ncbi:hypothetical protein BDV97DRAFT_397899 [Delphinella strobiligena]|nr:hypothetical protein BDV97DRAFT_397899 [Delphinella strobiligena]